MDYILRMLAEHRPPEDILGEVRKTDNSRAVSRLQAGCLSGRAYLLPRCGQSPDVCRARAGGGHPGQRWQGAMAPKPNLPYAAYARLGVIATGVRCDDGHAASAPAGVGRRDAGRRAER